MKKTILIVLTCTFSHLPSSLFGAAASDAVAQVATQFTRASSLPVQPTNGLLIILDDEDLNSMGATALAQAIFEKASPLVVSASSIAQVYQEHSAAELTELEKRFHELNALPPDKWTEKDCIDEVKTFIALKANLNAQTADDWIIKEINPSLYLLLHKSYLTEKRIPTDAVIEYHDQAPLTAVEMQLGLKVNHMRTVKATAIKKPTPQPELADYFTEALRKNSLFITNSEYTQEFSEYHSAWSIFIVGHGLMHTMVAGIALDEFKEFLSFLENKVSTKLLYYVSCFGAGENSHRLYSSSYNNTQEGVDKTYPFAIITQALTDATVYIQFFKVKFTQFLHLATTSDCINYRELAACITPDLNDPRLAVGNLAQVKFPGLEWFSVIDESKVVSIGSVLAKTRTAPLNIETFFKKKGEQARPLAILLYTQNIPFELIINSIGAFYWPPLIISMIPGNAFHTIKKISSYSYSTDHLMGSISSTVNLEAHKTFVVEELEGLFSSYMHQWLPFPKADKTPTGQNTGETEKWVVIDRSNKDKEGDTLSFMYEGLLYHRILNQTSSPVTPVSDTKTKDDYLLVIQKAMQQQHPSEQKPPVAEPSIERKSIHEHTTQETMKALADTLTNKENRETWLQRFADTIKNDTEWIKVGAQWIKKEAEQLAAEVAE